MRKAQMVTLVSLLNTVLLVGCGTEPAQRVFGPTAKQVQPAESRLGHDTDPEWSPWSEPASLGPIVNSSSHDIGPELSPDGLSLYLTSDRPGGLGGFDLWASRRTCLECPWQSPVDLGPNINSPGGDGSPGFSADGHLLFFSSPRDGGFGGDDIWVTHRENVDDDFAWGTPVNLGPEVNTAEDETGPLLLPNHRGFGHHTLYFSRGGSILQVELKRHGEAVGPAVPVEELNFPGVNNTDPTVSADGRELIFWSTRPGGVGGADLWFATRGSARDPWSAPQNLGAPVNTVGTDFTPALSRDGTTLFFAAGANARPTLGFQDIWMSTRTRLSRHHHEDDRHGRD
jgi:hypothetical protein